MKGTLKDKVTNVWLWTVAVIFSILGACAFIVWVGVIVLSIIKYVKGT